MLKSTTKTTFILHQLCDHSAWGEAYEVKELLSYIPLLLEMTKMRFKDQKEDLGPPQFEKADIWYQMSNLWQNKGKQGEYAQDPLLQPGPIVSPGEMLRSVKKWGKPTLPGNNRESWSHIWVFIFAETCERNVNLLMTAPIRTPNTLPWRSNAITLLPHLIE